jgi:predicted RNase H-like nuclease (RuvC/YqgF family)
MNALMKKKEDTMSVEDRLASLESDVKYLRNDMTDVKQHIRSLDNSLQSFKTEVAKEFGAVRTEAAGLRAEMNKEFGAVRVSIESLKTSIESIKTSIEKSKLWMLVTGVGVVMSTVVTLAHALKLF